MNRYRTITTGIILGLWMILIPTLAISSETEPVRPITVQSDSLGVTQFLAQLESDGRSYLQAPEKEDRPPTLDMGAPDNEDVQYSKPKSPLKAFIYSAIIPGAGQLYNGSKYKAALFLGLEALTWTGHAVYHSKGNTKTGEFEDFANIHWSETRYSQFLYDNWEVYDDELVFEGGFAVFTHHLPDTKTQQYYEMIGKYNQFVFGWDDVDTLATPAIYNNLEHAYSANREHYENMRHDANKMFDKATTALIATITNHLISGVEAALAARSHNKNVDVEAQRLTFRAIMAEIDDDHFPMLTMSYTF